MFKTYDSTTASFVERDNVKRYDSTAAAWVNITSAKTYDTTEQAWVERYAINRFSLTETTLAYPSCYDLTSTDTGFIFACYYTSTITDDLRCVFTSDFLIQDNDVITFDFIESHDYLPFQFQVGICDTNGDITSLMLKDAGGGSLNTTVTYPKTIDVGSEVSNSGYTEPKLVIRINPYLYDITMTNGHTVEIANFKVNGKSCKFVF